MPTYCSQRKSVSTNPISVLINSRPITMNSSEIYPIQANFIPIPTNSNQFQFQSQPIPTNSNSNSNQFQPIPILIPTHFNQFQFQFQPIPTKSNSNLIQFLQFQELELTRIGIVASLEQNNEIFCFVF